MFSPTGCLFEFGFFRPCAKICNACPIMAKLDLFERKHLSFCESRIKPCKKSLKLQNFCFEIFCTFFPIVKQRATTSSLGGSGRDMEAKFSVKRSLKLILMIRNWVKAQKLCIFIEIIGNFSFREKKICWNVPSGVPQGSCIGPMFKN